ncbi:hypothetical protein MACJ_003336 [Theileria orientalis]|uniref:Uncharacterized protein n=1 Tax=Theileria orientalis TaxID=68886 RepID=A0A976SK06_THEOR|nr:hypothetical protein MACJ_003336 [Theileria orientalis]
MKKPEFIDEFVLKGMILTWASTILLSFFHILTTFKLTQLSCERSLINYNATCAATILLFGSVACVSTSLGIPVKILSQILQRVSFNTIKDNDRADLLSVSGVIIFAILSALMPLTGFFKVMSASRCRHLKSPYFLSTVGLNCLDIFFIASVTWVLMRRKDLELFRTNVERIEVGPRLKKH